jgi:cytoskeletal protein RodZ
MAKIGSILLETRLSKGLTLDSIADETNISVRFLAKLENDDFSGFPGEPYIIGFIRNYGEYLGLDTEALVIRYRSKEAIADEAGNSAAFTNATQSEPSNLAGPAGVQEKPENPAEQRDKQVTKAAVRQKKKKSTSVEIPKQPDNFAVPPPPDSMSAGQNAPAARTSPPLRTIIMGILVVLIIGAAMLWVFAGGKLRGSSNNDKEGFTPTEYKVEGGDFQKRLYPGDSLLVPFAEDVYRISLGSIGETVILDTPFGSKELRLGESAELDPDANDTPDILLALEDFQKDSPTAGALLKISFIESEATESTLSGEVTVPQATPTPAPPGKNQDFVILKSTRGPYPFIVQVSFRGNCLFRYEADRKEWVEKYYSKGESININVTNALTLWSSNAQAVKLTVQASGGRSVDVEIGGAGEIAVKRLSWSKVDSATWALSSSELD